MADATGDVANWLPAAQAGSREALGQALEACRAYLLLVANRELDPALQAKGGASDLVQETFFEAQRDFARFSGRSAEELKAWLRQMLLNNLSNFARRYRDTDKRQLDREVALATETPSGGWNEPTAKLPSPSRQLMARERIEELFAALANLPEDYRRVITLRYQGGCSFEQIATHMQRSENAVRKLWFRAIERLEQEMDAPGEIGKTTS
jgi:RNA polymerase sigma-70 factor (ECF subfamily)